MAVKTERERELVCVLSFGCFSSVVITCQVIGQKDPSEEALTWRGDHLHNAQAKKSLRLCWFIVFFRCFIA